METAEFWSSYEQVVENYSALHEKIVQLSNSATSAGRVLVWRGQKDGAWALHSKLYRNYLTQKPSRITENAFAELEHDILKDLRRWGLHSQRIGGRLSILSQLAMLQHFGSPTRLLDVTFNALVGAFFATEKHIDHDKADARLFAIDVTDRLINENKHLRDWEDALDTPWSTSFISDHFKKLKNNGHSLAKQISEDEFRKNWLHEWSSHFYAWRPPALDARIAAQNGGFVFGGIVGTSLREGYLDIGLEDRRGGFQLVDPGQKDARLTIDDTRRLTCLAIQPKPFPTAPIRKNSTSSVYCIRIISRGKEEIRSKLRQIFGYTHATIYPDFSGFAQFGEGTLQNVAQCIPLEKHATLR